MHLYTFKMANHVGGLDVWNAFFLVSLLENAVAVQQSVGKESNSECETMFGS